jgi:thiamine pyrophosphate-dependent acetolactate synthase large subunit-like protein
MDEGANRLDRRAVVRALLAERGELLLVTGLGSATYDAAAAGDDDRNFYLWGAMGGSVMVGLGLALAQPDRPVAVITGDGDLLMGIGSLATVGVQAPANLSIVVLDNERYGETGMQATHTAHGVDLAAVARACGFRQSTEIRKQREVESLRETIHAGAGPVFAAIKVIDEKLPLVLPPHDGVLLKTRLRRALLGDSADMPAEKF